MPVSTVPLTAATSSTDPARDPTRIDHAAVAAHNIGRGDFAALVFAGPRASLDGLAGHDTWNTPRKFTLADPRLPAPRSKDRRPERHRPGRSDGWTPSRSAPIR